MNCKLAPVGIALLNSVTSPQVSVVLLEWLDVILKQIVLLSLLASFKLLDIVNVGPPHNCKATQEEGQPAVALIIEAVGLVPIREYANILVSVVSLITGLEALARQLGVDILLRNICQRRVCSLVRVRIIEHVHATGAGKGGQRGGGWRAQGCDQGFLEHGFFNG